MATTLKDLKITSTDLVDAGANPDAKISLFKRGANAVAGLFKKGAPVAKDAQTFNDKAERAKRHEICEQIWDYCYAFKDSLCSIILDADLDDGARQSMMSQSFEEFATAMKAAIPTWAALKCLAPAQAVVKCSIERAALESLIEKYAPLNEAPPEEISPVQVEKFEKEEFDTMNIDKSKLTPEERAALEAIEKKYGTGEAATPATPPSTAPASTPVPEVAKGAAEPPATPPVEKSSTGVATGVAAASPELHPEVKKALADMQALTAQNEELRKSLEVERLAGLAKKYEPLGKKADELAVKLYELKKVGGTVYDDYVAVLDEQLTLVEKSGLFEEIGSGRSSAGSASENSLLAKAAEIRKGNPAISQAAALEMAADLNRDLFSASETEYEKSASRINMGGVV